LKSIVLFCLLQLSYLPLRASDFDTLSRQANEAREAARVTEAIGLYRQALDLRPDWDAGWFYVGTLLYSADRNKEAVDAFATLLKLHPKNGVAWAFKGLSLAQLGKTDEALDALENARLFGVGDNTELVAATRYSLGILLNKYSRFDDAHRELVRLVNAGREPDDLVIALGLSALLEPYLPSELPPAKRELVTKVGRAEYNAELKRFDDASTLYAEAIAGFSQVPNLHYAYGVYLERQARPEAAEAEFLREIAVSPSHVPARLHLASEYIRRQDVDAALPIARDAAEMAAGSYIARQIYGRVLLMAEDAGAAIKELEAAVQLRPDDPTSHFQLARAYRLAGKREMADRQDTEFMRLDAARKKLAQVGQ
jgi:tetratricopeptide (TPR) repeat protein